MVILLKVAISKNLLTTLSEDSLSLCPHVARQVHLPFAVVGSTEEVKIGNKMAKARQYPWGVVQGMCATQARDPLCLTLCSPPTFLPPHRGWGGPQWWAGGREQQDCTPGNCQDEKETVTR